MKRILIIATLLLASFTPPLSGDTGIFDQSAAEKYTGEIRNDVPHGKGVMEWTDGRRYEGEWKYGEQDGSGVYQWPGGEIYKGQWREGKWHGQGVYTKANGTTMSGEWKNGNMWNIEALHPDGTKSYWKNGIPQ